MHAALIGGVGRIAHDDGVDEADLELERRAQRAGGDHLAVADPALSVDQRNRQILGNRCILQAIIHDDDARLAAARLDGDDARAPVVRDERRRDAGKQQRLISVKPRGAGRDLDPCRPGRAPTVAACQEDGPLAAREQQPGDVNGKRRLARAAGREIADANDRQA